MWRIFEIFVYLYLYICIKRKLIWKTMTIWVATILIWRIFAIFQVNPVHCFDRVGATMKFATDSDEKCPNFLFSRKTRRRSWIYLHLSQIQLKKEFSKVKERQKDEFTVVAVIINAWVSEVEAWNLLIYINLSPRQTLVIYVLKWKLL